MDQKSVPSKSFSPTYDHTLWPKNLERIVDKTKREKRAKVPSKSVRLSKAQLRADAILMFNKGSSAAEAADLLGVSRQTVYNWVNRYRSRANQDLSARFLDAERSGRPKIADGKIDQWIAKVIDCAPSSYGYHATEWTAELLRIFLMDFHGIECSRNTVRRSISRLRLKWKRSRYELALRSPTWRQAKGG